MKRSASVGADPRELRDRRVRHADLGRFKNRRLLAPISTIALAEAKQAHTQCSTSQARQRASNQIASGEPGAVDSSVTGHLAHTWLTSTPDINRGCSLPPESSLPTGPWLSHWVFASEPNQRHVAALEAWHPGRRCKP